MSAESELDIRWPIGLLFSIMGALVALYGLVSSARAMYRPVGSTVIAAINLNLWWGLIMLAFGAFMILGAIRAGHRGGE